MKKTRKYTPEQYQEKKAYNRTWARTPKGRALAKRSRDKAQKKLYDFIVVQRLKDISGLPTEVIKLYPNLIKLKRAQLLLAREIRNKLYDPQHTITRICVKCGRRKLLNSDNFGMRATGKGYETECKICRYKRVQEYRKNTPELQRKYSVNAYHRLKKDKKKYKDALNKKRQIIQSYRDNIDDYYICKLFGTNHKIPFSLTKLFPNLIEFKRTQLLLLRTIKHIQNETS